MPSLRDHLRAALVCAHLAAITVAAVPTPEGDLTEANLRNPEVHRALAPWARLAVRLGFAEDEAAGRAWLVARGRDMVALRRAVVGPIRPYLRFTGNGQSWRMFGVAPARHGRLQVHGRGPDGTWVALYDERRGSDWGWVLLDHSRIRSLRSSFADRQQRGRYNAFARWLGRRALADHPELVAVRVRYEGYVIPPPDELRRYGGLRATRVYWPVEVPRRSPR